MATSLIFTRRKINIFRLAYKLYQVCSVNPLKLMWNMCMSKVGSSCHPVSWLLGKWEFLHTSCLSEPAASPPAVYADISVERMDPISHDRPCFPRHQCTAQIHMSGGCPWFSGTFLTAFPRLLLSLATQSNTSESTLSVAGKYWLLHCFLQCGAFEHVNRLHVDCQNLMRN